MRRKRLMIGIPGYEGIVSKCQENFAGMIFRLGRDTDMDVAVKIVVKKEQFRARNSLVDAALAGGFDYLLMLDDDMIVPHDLPMKLIQHDKDVVGALYYQRGGMYHPVVMDEGMPNAYGEVGFTFWHHGDARIVDNPGLHQVDVIGGGCMLFKVPVFEKIPRPCFEWEQHLGTDIAICHKARQAGYEIWIDTSIELGHIGEPEVVTSRTIPLERRVLSEEAERLGHDLEAYYAMPKEWIIQQMDMATQKSQRKDRWGERSQEWEDVQSYYRDHDSWHVFNLAGFNIWHSDMYRAWMLNEGIRLLGSGTLLDYGPGVGSVAIPVARAGAKVYAVEIKDAATIPFLRFRQNRHWESGKRLAIWETETPYPAHPLPEKMDGACCISVLNHLTHPLETMAWIRDQLKPGAFFVCDWALHSDHADGEEPQHIDAYDLATFVPYMHSLGFSTSPELPWLFFYQP